MHGKKISSRIGIEPGRKGMNVVLNIWPFRYQNRRGTRKIDKSKGCVVTTGRVVRSKAFEVQEFLELLARFVLSRYFAKYRVK